MDELYWNAVIWPRPAVVEKAKVTVHLPSELRGKNRKMTSYGAGAAISRDTGPDTIEFNSMGAIPAETGLQIHVGFQHGILHIDRPHWQPDTSVWKRLRSRNVTIAFAVAAAVGTVVSFFRGRCPLCGKWRALKCTGEKENLNADKVYWFLGDYIWLYKCRFCDYKEWKRRRSGGW